MKQLHFPSAALALTAAAVAGLLAQPVGAAERRSIDEHRPVDAQGQVEVVDVSGKIKILGWDKPELAVSGTVGDNVDKIDISTAGNRTTVRVVLKEKSSSHWEWSGKMGDADLVVHLPRGNSISASLVSADLEVADLQGNQEIVTVSGDVHSAAAHDLRVRTVSGDMQLTAGPDTKVMEINTVSGDMHVTGGGGEVTVGTVSGDGMLSLGAAGRVRVKTVSGDFNVTTGLAADGRFEAESVSGDFVIAFTGAAPPAEYDVQSFSGELSSCFGAQPAKEHYGPGSRLSYKEGAGTARVKIDTKSGDVRICTKK